jgi:hypothetical protein
MFGSGVFLKSKNFHLIVIVVPFHVSKFYRVLKKLTAYPGLNFAVHSYSHEMPNIKYFIGKWASDRGRETRAEEASDRPSKTDSIADKSIP